VGAADDEINSLNSLALQPDGCPFVPIIR